MIIDFNIGENYETDRKVVIDYLNLASIFYLIKNERNSNVIALHRPASAIMEYFLVVICNLFRIKYTFDRLMFSKLSVDPMVDIISKLNSTVDELGGLYRGAVQSKIDGCYRSSFKRWLFNDLHRSITIVEYTKKLNIDVDAVYVSSSLNSDLLIGLRNDYSMGPDGFELYYYSAFGLIDDDCYTRKKVSPKIKLLGGWLSSVLRLLYVLLYTPLRSKLDNCRVDVLLFSHDTHKKWLGIAGVSNYLNLKCMFVYPDENCVFNNNTFKLSSMPKNRVFSYYIYMVKGCYNFFWLLYVNANWTLFVYMLYEWRNNFFLNLLYDECSIKLVLAAYESNVAQNAVAIASDNNMVSFSGQWSLGDYPSENCISWHKFPDRYFISGSWHYELMRASNDKSSGYIVSGYIGDNYIQLMKDKARIFRAQHLRKIITVYDTGSTEDTPTNSKSLVDYVSSILTIASEFDALVVIKGKRKGSPDYTDIINIYDNECLIIDYEKGSLVPALASDVVIGVYNSTPASISACHGKQAIMYDPGNLVWDQWELDAHYVPMLYTLNDLQLVLRELLSNKKPQKTINTEKIDPFADGKSQYRMAKYMECVFDNLHHGKKEALLYADNEYKRRWGKDKLYVH